jgi:hypothetical protein
LIAAGVIGIILIVLVVLAPTTIAPLKWLKPDRVAAWCVVPGHGKI